MSGKSFLKKNNLSSRRKILLSACMMIAFAIGVAQIYLKSYTEAVVTESVVSNVDSNNEDTSIAELLGGVKGEMVVEQTFITDQEFCGVSIFMGTYAKKINIGEIEVIVTDLSSGKNVLDMTRRMETIKDLSYNAFTSDTKIIPDGRSEYKITIKGNHVPKGCAVNVWKTKVETYEEGILTYCGEKQAGDICFSLVTDGSVGFASHAFALRMLILLILFVFLSLHIFYDLEDMYQKIYRYRWIIAGCIFVFCLVFKINGSSMGQYDVYIQTGYGSDFVHPLFGVTRADRSDEWIVSLTRAMSAEYSDYGLYNDIVMGTRHTNMSASGLYFSYSLLAEPSKWGYYLFGTERGLSFIWSGHIIFGFMFSFELCRILTKNKKLLSLLGANLIWFSTYNMSWSVTEWLFAGQAALVFFYYFLKEEKTWRRLLWGFGISVFAAEFCVNFYPAWQVPAGYVYLGLLVWMFFSQKEIWKKFTWKDWMTAVISIIFLASIVLAFLKNDLEYIQDISATVYPAGRTDYGGFALNKLFNYLSSTLSGWIDYSNSSEMSCFFTLFPLSLIAFLYILIREKGKNMLMWCLLIPTMFLSAYCTVELPHKLAEITLMTNSITSRAIDIVGYANVLMLIIGISEYEDHKDMQIKWYISALVVGACLAVAFVFAQNMEIKKTFVYTAGLAIIAFVTVTIIISNLGVHIKQPAMIGLTITIIICGIRYNPIQVGTDALTSKPVADEIKEIVQDDPDAKWIGVGCHVAGDYLVALGAKAVNSTNYVPNLEFWEQFDPAGNDEEIYNRYAHLIVYTTDEETTYSLTAQDSITLNLNYTQLKDVGVRYLFTREPLESDLIELYPIYAKYGVYIYKTNY